jgi:HK97 family phage portal protein
LENQDFIKQLQDAEAAEKQAIITRNLLLNKAFNSDNPDLIYKAQKHLEFIEKRQEIPQKSMIIDPSAVSSEMGWRDKQIALSFEVMRKVSMIPVVKAIIETRKEQVISFAQPQPDKYSPGFVIRPKKSSIEQTANDKLSKAQQKQAEYLTNFILNCGNASNRWHGDTFDSFLRKFIQDSLSLDQGCFEVIRNRKGQPIEFFAVDGATIRIADSNDGNDQRREAEKINGYFPSHVQIYMSRIVAEFYPWELCFGTRNPQTDIYAGGYGRSEIEDLIATITNILNADMYNANYFKMGSNPKGILKVSGNVNETRIQELKAQWQSQMAGVANAHKMPIIEAEKLDFISTQGNNKDMEYSKYYEFLLKITCAVYKIDPSEIGFPMSGSSDAKPMFEGNNAERLAFSKDKGLKPLLKFIQQQINKYIIDPLDETFEFAFVGIDAETSQQELENDVKAVQNWQTVNEIRRKRGMEDIEGGDIVLNPVMMQAKQMTMQGNPESNQAMDEQDQQQPQESDNPFEKAFADHWNKLMEE